MHFLSPVSVGHQGVWTPYSGSHRATVRCQPGLWSPRRLHRRKVPLLALSGCGQNSPPVVVRSESCPWGSSRLLETPHPHLLTPLAFCTDPLAIQQLTSSEPAKENPSRTRHHVTMGVTSHHLCHILLYRSKSRSIAPALIKGQRLHRV